MDVTVGNPAELGIVGVALMVVYFALRYVFLVQVESIKSQSKETEGSQRLQQQATALTETSLALLSQANDRISRTLEAMYELKRNDHTILMEIKETSQGSHNLLRTDIPAAVMRVETPVTVVLAAVNEMMPMIRRMNDFLSQEKLALERQLAIARHVKVEPASEHAEPAPASPSPTASEGAEPAKVAE